MFIQVIDGRVHDPEAFRRRWDAWLEECAAEAVGFQRSAGGVTPDGRGVIVAWFTSAEDAARNAGRPEQDSWWKETAPVFEGRPRFSESEDITTAHGSPASKSRFVQLMRAKYTSRAEIERIEEEVNPLFVQWRPDVLSAQRLWLPANEMLAVDFFTSEEEARAGEKSEPPPGLPELFGQWQAQLTDVEWLDLPEPWHATP